MNYFCLRFPGLDSIFSACTALHGLGGLHSDPHKTASCSSTRKAGESVGSSSSGDSCLWCFFESGSYEIGLFACTLLVSTVYSHKGEQDTHHTTPVQLLSDGTVHIAHILPCLHRCFCYPSKMGWSWPEIGQAIAAIQRVGRAEPLCFMLSFSSSSF